MIFVGENLYAKVAQITFRASLANSRKSPLQSQKLPAPTPVMKKHIRSRCPPL